MENLFDELNKINVGEKTEKKGNLTYLSWSWAWSEFKKKCPGATYKIKKFGENKLPYVYDEKTGYMVFTEVSVDDLTHEMWLPVMDFRNKAMKETATMFDINKTIMRCLTKNLAMFGLGLYIYAGEDLPENDTAIDKKNSEELSKKWLEIKRICNELSPTPMASRPAMIDFIAESTHTDTKDPNEIINMLTVLLDEKQLTK